MAGLDGAGVAQASVWHPIAATAPQATTRGAGFPTP
jgi:hypothetical protein